MARLPDIPTIARGVAANDVICLDEAARSPSRDEIAAALRNRLPELARELLGHDCKSACKKDPLLGVIGIQLGPPNRGATSASMILGSRGWNAGRGDDCKDSPRIL